MAVVTKKRSVMTLYSGSKDMESHRVRLVLAEKGILADIIELGRHSDFEDLTQLNPYNTVPTLVDRDLVLYHSGIIMEYLDERFPHPPLLPVYPVARAKYRLMMFRIDHDWCGLVNKILQNGPDVDEARRMLTEELLGMAPAFVDFPYFLSEEFSLVDCCVAPIMWRLDLLGVKLPASAKPIIDYAKRIFARESFQASLTESEREL